VIVTVTPNPSVDLTFEVPELAIGEVNRAISKHRDPAGKGINVARALHRNGVATTAVFPADADNGAWLARALGAAGIAVSTTPIAQPIRENMTFVAADGTTTKINEPGPHLSADEVDALLRTLDDALVARPAWVVVAGSLPLGVAPTLLARIGEHAHRRGARLAVDTSGDALASVVDAGIADVLKPNLDELEEIAGRPLATYGDIESFARTLLSRDGAEVLVSLGEGGALLVTRDRLLWAGHAPVVPVSTVGAGDCALAGYLHADVSLVGFDDPAPLRLATAVAWGAAAVRLPATSVPGPADIRLDAVRLDLDPDRATSVLELTR